MGVKEELRSLIVWNPNIQLRQGEVCFFFSKVQYGTPHLETTTKVKPGIGLGVVVPVTKHFGLGLGKRKVKTEISTQKVWDKESCELYVMDDRIALKFKCGVMDIDLGTVTNLKVNKDALTISCGAQDHVLFMPNRDVKRFMSLFNLIVQVEKMGLDMADFVPGYNNAPNQAPVYAPTPSAPETQSNTVSDDYAKAIFLWAMGRKPATIKKRDEYPRYLYYECNIQNGPEFHKEMIEQGYLAPPSPADTISSLKVGELKEILQENGLTTTGKKADLVQSIVANVPNEKLVHLVAKNVYVLSDYGKQFLEAHDGYVQIHTHSAWQITQAEYDTEKAATPNAKFNDICWRIFNRRITQTHEISAHRNIYYNMYTLTKEEGRNKDALDLLLRVLYIDLSGSDNPAVDSYRRGWMNQSEFAERVESSILFAPAVVKEIGDLEESFSDDMLTRLYQWQLPTNLCPNTLFTDIVHSIIAGTFDEAKYKGYLATEYRNCIRK